ncbi:MAG: Gfo/Idh/MocA family oxidoreductase [Bacteroidota bacterium]
MGNLLDCSAKLWMQKYTKKIASSTGFENIQANRISLDSNSTTMKIRFGIIGFGRFAEKAILPAFRSAQNAELVAIHRRTADAARESADRWSVPHGCGTVEELLALPNLDAVFILSPNAFHAPHTIASARAGKHVLVEKPMAIHAEEARTMIDVCRKEGVRLMVGHMVRFSPVIRRMRELVAGGSIGTPVHGRSEFVYDGSLSTRSWLLDRRIAGGGPVVDIGVHCLDTLRYVLDDEVVKVQSILEPEGTTDTVEETAQLLLRFSRGTLGSVYCSYRSAIRSSSIEILGSEAILSTENFTVGNRVAALRIVRKGPNGSEERFEESFDVPDLYEREITHFSECILNDSEPMTGGGNGLVNQLILDAALGTDAGEFRKEQTRRRP